MDLRKLKTLIDLVAESGVSELEVTEGEDKVRIVKNPAPIAAPLQQVYAAAPAAAPAAASASASYSSESSEEGTLAADESLAALRDKLKSAE